MAAFSTDYSFRKMLATPINEFKKQLFPLKQEQIEGIVKGWLKECQASKPAADQAEKFFTRAVCVLPVSCQKHFEALAGALNFDPNSKGSFACRMMFLQNSDPGKKQLARVYSLDLECTSDLQLELLSLDFALNQGLIPTVEQFKALLRPKLLDCRTPAGKDILQIMSERDVSGLEKLAQPLVDCYLEVHGAEVFARRIFYRRRQYLIYSPKNNFSSLFGDAIAKIEKHKPLGIGELWEGIQKDFGYEAPYWHYRYDSLITDSIPEAESRLQEELNILAILLSDSRCPEGRKLCCWSKILEDQKGELRPLLKKELLDVRSSRNLDIYDEVLRYSCYAASFICCNSW